MNFSSSSAVRRILMFSPKVENDKLFATFPLLQLVSKIDKTSQWSGDSAGFLNKHQCIY